MDSTLPSFPDQDRRYSEDLSLTLNRNKGKKRVGFTPDTAPSSPNLEAQDDHSWIPNGDLSLSPAIPLASMRTNSDPSIRQLQSYNSLEKPSLTRPKPVLRQSSHSNADEIQLAISTENSPSRSRENHSGKLAHERATKLAQSIGQDQSIYSSASTQTSFFPIGNPFLDEEQAHDVHDEPQIDTESDDGNESDFPELQRSNLIDPNLEHEDIKSRSKNYRRGVLATLLHLSESKPFGSNFHSRISSPESDSQFTPTPNRSPFPSGASTPTSREGLLKHVPYFHHKKSGSSAFSSSSTLALSPFRDFGDELTHRLEQHARRPSGKRHGSAISRALRKLGKNGHDSDERLSIEKHIRDVVSRQRYLVTLCRALMTYGAPTHRLEEYLSMSARILQIEGQFMYLPGSMIISFDDSETHTSGVKVIRPSGSAVSLSKLQDTHEIYKDVVHDVIDVKEGNKRLEKVMERAPIRGPWLLVLYYGLASVAVGPFAFGAGWIDLPVLFGMGALVGALQHLGIPRSSSYAHVFEVTAAFLTSLIARGLGSIHYPGRPESERLFCFSALAQSGVALILPGYTLLCAALELQSQIVIAGSVRLVYAIIYTLFLGFGITLGTVLYGVMDSNATSDTTCAAGHSIPQMWQQFLFVPLFAITLVLVNQGRWRQMPPMVFIAFVGYIVTHYGSKELVKGNAPLGTMMGAMAIGLLANLYARLGVGGKLEQAWEKMKIAWRGRRSKSFSRWLKRGHDDMNDAEEGIKTSKTSRSKSRGNKEGDSEETGDRDDCQSKSNAYGLAAVLMLPAIFVQVPSGLAISGSLVSGIASADSIVHNTTSSAGNFTASTTSSSSSDGLGSVAFNVSYSIIQIAIGITVGLSVSAWLVWPSGKKKRRSGLFTL